MDAKAKGINGPGRVRGNSHPDPAHLSFDADVRAAWKAAAKRGLAALTAETPRPGIVDVPEQWLVLVTCRDEKEQVELLERFRREGLECKALLG
jgi:hypothetical protein